MDPILQRPLSHWTPRESMNSHTDGRTSSVVHQRYISDVGDISSFAKTKISFIFPQETKQAETRLLDLYSSKFHLQNEWEYKLSKDVRTIFFHHKILINSLSSSIITN